MPKKERLVSVMLERALFNEEKEANAAVMAGEVYVNGQRAKPGMLIPLDAEISVKNREGFASKGVLKLTGALEDFGIDVTGRVCIDAGASTGGFTDCLVRRGAELVYAVDVGYGQLMGALRQNPRVVNLEKTNISDEKLLNLTPRPDLGTVDLSYLSLKKGIPQFAGVLHHEGELVCLVKPLFETEDMAARRSGVLSEQSYAPILADLAEYVNHLPYATAMNVTHSPVTGNTGTREFFLHVRLQKLPPPDLTGAIDHAVQRALSLRDYKK